MLLAFKYSRKEEPPTRSSLQEVFCKMGSSNKSRKIHRKTPLPELFFIEKEALAQVFVRTP